MEIVKQITITIKLLGVACSAIKAVKSVSAININTQKNIQKYAASFGVSKENLKILLQFFPDDDPRINLAKIHP